KRDSVGARTILLLATACVDCRHQCPPEYHAMDAGDQIENQIQSAHPGQFVAFMGLPGCGKTTIASRLAGLIACAALFWHPEELAWPTALSRRQEYGYLSAITCFRSMRVPHLFMAHAIRGEGGVAIVDSYYDKLLSRYITHDLMDWLIPKSDPYFDVAVSL